MRYGCAPDHEAVRRSSMGYTDYLSILARDAGLLNDGNTCRTGNHRVRAMDAAVVFLRAQRGPLGFQQIVDASMRQGQEVEQLALAKRLAFGCALDFDQSAAARHDDVHIDV